MVKAVLRGMSASESWAECLTMGGVATRVSISRFMLFDGIQLVLRQAATHSHVGRSCMSLLIRDLPSSCSAEAHRHSRAP